MKHWYRSFAAVIAVLAIAGGPALVAQQTPPPAKPEQAKPEAKAEAKPDPKSVAGKWNLSLEGPQGAMAMALEVKLDGKKVTGTLEGPNGPTPIEGEFADGKLGFTISFDAGGTALSVYFENTIKPDGKLAGTATAGDMGSFPFTGERVKGN